MNKLATYLFYITQAEDKIKRENIINPTKKKSVYVEVCSKVKDVVLDMEKSKHLDKN